jgi:hypothetical protein
VGLDADVIFIRENGTAGPGGAATQAATKKQVGTGGSPKLLFSERVQRFDLQDLLFARALQPVYCSMKGYRTLVLGGRVPERGMPHLQARSGCNLHDALEDAWLAMQIYRWLEGRPLQGRLCGSLPRTPSNLSHTATRPYRVDLKGRTALRALFATAHAQMSSPWTAREPPKHCTLVEGVHEIAEAFQACISPA